MLKKRQLNIQAKFITISLALLIIPLLCLGIMGYLKTKDTLSESGRIRLETSVEMTIEMIQALHSEVEAGNITLEDAQQKVLNAVLGEEKPDGTRSIKETINLGKRGYIYIMDQQGVIIASAETSRGDQYWDATDSNGNTYIQEIISKANNGGGITYFDWQVPNTSDIERKINYSKTDPHWDWVISATTYVSNFNQPATSILYYFAIIFVVCAIIGGSIVWYLANKITRPIISVTKQMDLLAQGDLTSEDIVVKSNDETGRLAHSLNQMKHRLRGIVSHLSDATSMMSSQSEELNQSTNEVVAGSEQIARSMEDLSSGAVSEADHTNQLSTLMEEFSSKVQEANANGEQIEAASAKVLTMTNQGSELMESSAAQMERIDRIVKDAVSKVEGLDQHSQQISELVAVINDIAEQTNLLSLNAQIEAARAGEHGRGFAVVADEVRKLADQSAKSVTNITEIVQMIQSESGVVVSSLQDGYEEVTEGTNQIHRTKETFEQITNSINDVVRSIKVITGNSNALAQNSIKMNASIQEIAAMSEESAAGIEETSASSEQISSSMQEVSASADKLAELAEQLNDLVSQFKL